MIKTVQAKHLDVRAILLAVAAQKPCAFNSHLEAAFPGVPYKVIRARMRSLIRQGFCNGCACGCSGAYSLLDKGRALLAQAL